MKVKTSSREKYKPWFVYEHRCFDDVDNIVFGHWAALNGVTNHNFIKGVDLGCVWGGSLAAINLTISRLLQLNQNYENL